MFVFIFFPFVYLQRQHKFCVNKESCEIFGTPLFNFNEVANETDHFQNEMQIHSLTDEASRDGDTGSLADCSRCAPPLV